MDLSFHPNVLKELRKTSFSILGEWTDVSEEGEGLDPALAVTKHLRTFDSFCSFYFIERYQDIPIYRHCGPPSGVCVKIYFEGDLANYESAAQASEVLRCISRNTLWKWTLEKTREGAPLQAVPDEIKILVDTLNQALALEQALRKGTRANCKFKCRAVALCQTGAEDRYVEVPEMWTDKFFQCYANGLKEAKEERGSHHPKMMIKIKRTSLALSEFMLQLFLQIT